MIAYSLCVKDFMARKFLTIYLAITMFFSGGMITTYLLIRNLKMFNTAWAMTLPVAISAYSVFVYRAFMQGISMQLRESAKIDGANDIVILFRIYLPLSKALLATFGLFSVVYHWNSWYPALLYLRDRNLHPIQMVLREVLFVSGAEGGTFDRVSEFVTTRELHPKNVQMACVMATTAPILVAYPFIQKHFMKGIMIGSIKG
jgi:putative aldouronate transport system permease protein